MNIFKDSQKPIGGRKETSCESVSRKTFRSDKQTLFSLRPTRCRHKASPKKKSKMSLLEGTDTTPLTNFVESLIERMRAVNAFATQFQKEVKEAFVSDDVVAARLIAEQERARRGFLTSYGGLLTMLQSGKHSVFLIGIDEIRSKSERAYTNLYEEMKQSGEKATYENAKERHFSDIHPNYR